MDANELLEGAVDAVALCHSEDPGMVVPSVWPVQVVEKKCIHGE
jgi:hypothetical protein